MKSTPVNAIELGPFKTEYHRGLVDGLFKSDLARLLEEQICPQADHDIHRISGTVTSQFDEERFCGPNSLVRNLFRLELIFEGSDEQSTLSTDVVYEPAAFRFNVRKGHSLYLWTPARRRERERKLEAIKGVIDSILAGDRSNPLCPLCGSALRHIDDSLTFDLACPNRCFKYNFHKDENGRLLHGHFFTGKLEDSGSTNAI